MFLIFLKSSWIKVSSVLSVSRNLPSRYSASAQFPTHMYGHHPPTRRWRSISNWWQCQRTWEPARTNFRELWTKQRFLYMIQGINNLIAVEAKIYRWSYFFAKFFLARDHQYFMNIPLNEWLENFLSWIF